MDLKKPDKNNILETNLFARCVNVPVYRPAANSWIIYCRLQERRSPSCYSCHTFTPLFLHGRILSLIRNLDSLQSYFLQCCIEEAHVVYFPCHEINWEMDILPTNFSKWLLTAYVLQFFRNPCCRSTKAFHSLIHRSMSAMYDPCHGSIEVSVSGNCRRCGGCSPGGNRPPAATHWRPPVSLSLAAPAFLALSLLRSTNSRLPLLCSPATKNNHKGRYLYDVNIGRGVSEKQKKTCVCVRVTGSVVNFWFLPYR